jgi:hypothetical protein
LDSFRSELAAANEQVVILSPFFSENRGIETGAPSFARLERHRRREEDALQQIETASETFVRSSLRVAEKKTRFSGLKPQDLRDEARGCFRRREEDAL